MKQFRMLLALLFALPSLVFADTVVTHVLFKNSPSDPYLLFKRLQLQALSTNNTGQNAGVLATINKDQYPQLYIINLDVQDGKGFHFASAQNTMQTQQLEQNQKASLLYSWELPDKQHIQVRITGDAVPMIRTNASSMNIDFMLNPRHIIFSLMEQKDKKNQLFLLSYVKQNDKWSMTQNGMNNIPSPAQ